MITRLVVASALVFTAAGAAFAADTPKSTADCMEQAFNLTSTAQEAKLSDSKAAEVDALLTKMEDACTSNNLSDAAKVQADIEAAIGK